MRSYDITNATIKSTARRRSAMKILMYLIDNLDAYTAQEIADDLDMDWTTTAYNLEKLLEAGFVSPVEDKMDSRTRYFEIRDKEASEKAIEYWLKRKGYELARFVPYHRIYATYLMKDKRFIETCEKLGLTLDQGIEAVLSCPKIEVERVGNDTILSRKEQGYDEPEKEKDETEVEEVF